MSPLNSNKLFFLIFQSYSTSQSILTICPQLKCTNVQLFSFFKNLCTVYFPKKNVRFFFLSFHAVFNNVQVSISFFYLFPLSCRPFFFSFYTKLLIHYLFIFLNLISASLCLYLDIVTIGSCLPVYSISNKYFLKISMVSLIKLFQ